MDDAPGCAVTDWAVGCDRRPEDGAIVMAGAPDEPLAVVAVGPTGAGRGAVLSALLGVPATALRVPRGSYLVIGPGETSEGEAYIPGYRRPFPYRPEPAGVGPALARPPRRIELTLPAPLLRQVNCVATPDTEMLGVAGRRVVRDVVERGGGLLFVFSAQNPPTPADLAFLAEIGTGKVAVFFVLTTGEAHARTAAGAGPARPGPADPGAHKAAVLDAVPRLHGAPWFVVDRAAPDVSELHQALTNWAALEALRRASVAPPVVPELLSGGVKVAAGMSTSDWEDRLERKVRHQARLARQSLALEVANIHLRSVQEIVFGAGCLGLPDQLDQELHALSIQAVRTCESGVRDVLADVITQLLAPTGQTADDVDIAPAIRRWLAVAVGWGLAEHRHGRDLDRLLLVGSDGAVQTVTGLGAVRALTAYPSGNASAVLPPLGIAVAGACYQFWRNPANADVAKARSWLQRALRDIEMELSREVLRRFAAVHAALLRLLRTAVAEGTLRLALDSQTRDAPAD